jgi:phage shock protein C
VQNRQKRLTRSSRERLWAGVAGGMAEYFEVDPVIMRIIWVAAAVLTSGLAIPAYIVMWLVMPRDDQSADARHRPAPPLSGIVDPGGSPREAWGGSPREAWGATPRETSWDATPRDARGDQPAYSTVGSPPASEGAAAEASASQPAPPHGLTPEEEDLLRPITPPPSDVPMVDEVGRRRRAAGILLIGLGVVFFAQQLGLSLQIPWRVLWPLAIVAVGVFILTRQGAGWRR